MLCEERAGLVQVWCLGLVRTLGFSSGLVFRFGQDLILCEERAADILVEALRKVVDQHLHAV
jgi:hypothetical protein